MTHSCYGDQKVLSSWAGFLPCSNQLLFRVEDFYQVEIGAFETFPFSSSFCEGGMP